MKKILVLAIVSLFVFTSCNTSKRLYSLSGNVIDYSYFSNKDFYITESNSVSFDYKPVGSIYIECKSGYELKGVKKQVTRNQFGNDVVSEVPDYGIMKLYDVNDALKKLHEMAIAKNANGVINLKLSTITEYDPIGKYSFTSGIAITGMLIKK